MGYGGVNSVMAQLAISAISPATRKPACAAQPVVRGGTDNQ
jgi:hypothetical protein